MTAAALATILVVVTLLGVGIAFLVQEALRRHDPAGAEGAALRERGGTGTGTG